MTRTQRESSALSWRRKLETEQRLRAMLSQIGPDGPIELRSKAARLWFTHVATIMNACARNSYNGSLDLLPPSEMFKVISDLRDCLGRGIVPQPIADVAIGKQGRKPRDPSESLHIAIAAAYMQYAKAGRIADKTPVKTIRDAYGVTRQAAQQWAKENIPSHLSIKWADWDDAELTSWLKIHVDLFGSIYRKHGRTSVAISSRAAD